MTEVCRQKALACERRREAHYFIHSWPRCARQQVINKTRSWKMCVHTQDAATGCVCRRLVVLILLPGGCRAAFSTPPTHYPPTFRVRLQLHNVLASNFCANFVWGNYLEPCASEYGRSNDKVVNCKTFHFLAERVIILLVELCCFLSVPQIASCFIKS